MKTSTFLMARESDYRLLVDGIRLKASIIARGDLIDVVYGEI